MTIDARGAHAPITAVASADVVSSAAITANGVARDLSNATLSIIVRDEKDGVIKEVGTYSQTITDAANGLFTFSIPKEAFANKEGAELSYRLIATENGNEISYAYGPIYVEEVY